MEAFIKYDLETLQAEVKEFDVEKMLSNVKGRNGVKKLQNAQVLIEEIKCDEREKEVLWRLNEALQEVVEQKVKADF